MNRASGEYIFKCYDNKNLFFTYFPFFPFLAHSFLLSIFSFLLSPFPFFSFPFLFFLPFSCSLHFFLLFLSPLPKFQPPNFLRVDDWPTSSYTTGCEGLRVTSLSKVLASLDWGVQVGTGFNRLGRTQAYYAEHWSPSYSNNVYWEV